jgi:hypothetical protein
MTSEYISPSGGETATTFSKFLTTRGVSISDAIYEVFTGTGQLASLGQCQVLVLGDSFYQHVPLNHVLGYFFIQEDFMDTAVLCCARGSAYDLMQTRAPQSDCISQMLTELMKDSAEHTSVQQTTIANFLRLQQEVGNADAISIVDVTSEEMPANKDPNAAGIQCTYSADTVAVFKDFKFVANMDKVETAGYSYIKSDSVGKHFNVADDHPEPFEDNRCTIIMTDKNSGVGCETKEGSDNVTLKVDAKLVGIVYSYTGKEDRTYPSRKRTTTDFELQQAKEMMTEELDAALQFSLRHNVDIFRVFRKFEIKYGKTWRDTWQEYTLDHFNYKLDVTTYEL